jgi:hypothetical protein
MELFRASLSCVTAWCTKPYRVYGEEVLARCQVALWLGDGRFVEYGRDTLSRYDVSFSPGETQLRGV